MFSQDWSHFQLDDSNDPLVAYLCEPCDRNCQKWKCHATASTKCPILDRTQITVHDQTVHPQLRLQTGHFLAQASAVTKRTLSPTDSPRNSCILIHACRRFSVIGKDGGDTHRLAFTCVGVGAPGYQAAGIVEELQPA